MNSPAFRAGTSATTYGSDPSDQIRLRVAQDLDDRLADGGCEVGELWIAIPAREHLAQTPECRVFHVAGQRVEGRRVNHVAQGIAHQAGVELKLAERSAFRVARAHRREPFRK